LREEGGGDSIENTKRVSRGHALFLHLLPRHKEQEKKKEEGRRKEKRYDKTDRQNIPNFPHFPEKRLVFVSLHGPIDNKVFAFSPVVLCKGIQTADIRPNEGKTRKSSAPRNAIAAKD
jgi:hypothetical protein